MKLRVVRAFDPRTVQRTVPRDLRKECMMLKNSKRIAAVARAASLSWVSLLLLGCTAREITIERDPVINTRSSAEGVPLSVDIVSVYPSDLEGPNRDLNKELDPTAGQIITSDVWFKRKPTRESMNVAEGDPTRFRIPREQIFSYTDLDPGEAYGNYRGGQIRGSKFPPPKIVVSGIPVAGWGGRRVHDSRSVIYVFGRFTDENGNVMKTEPAMFWSVGDFERKLAVRIKDDRIEAVTPRKYNAERDNRNKP